MSIKFIVLALFFLILLGIGYVASRRVKNIADYYVGGKKLGYWFAALSSRSTGESGWLFIGLTGLSATIGVSAFWILVGEIIGVFLLWQIIAKKLKRLTDKYESITIPDFLESHFGPTTSHTLRIVAATALSSFVVIYVSAQIDVTGKTFETFLGTNYYVGIALGFGIVTAYIFSGGFLAVAWSDFFQGTLMFVALLVLPVATYFYLPSDAMIVEGLRSIDPSLLNIWGPGGLTTINVMTILAFVFFGLGYLGSPQVLVRFIAIKSEAEIDKGKWVAIFYTLLTDTGAIVIGILGRYLFTQAGDNPEVILGNGGENVLSLVLNEVMPPLVVGIFIAAILSAIMSTVDSLLIVASSAISRDVYQKVLNPRVDEKFLIGFSKKITLVLAFLALGIALIVSVLLPERTIFWFIIFGWSGIAATFAPVIILTFFWKKYTSKGAVASMVIGFLGVPFFKFVAPKISFIGPYMDKLDVMLPSVLLAMLAGWAVSRYVG